MVKQVTVLGIGNVLMGDDALGPYAVRLFEAEYEMPEGVEAADIGTPGGDLVPHLEGTEAVILIDTVRSDGAAGELRLYRKDEILKHPPQPRVSPHDPGIKEALLTLDFAGRGPSEVLLVGVIPHSTTQSVGLHAAVRGALPAVHQAVLDELARLGRSPVRRETALQADIWWER